MNMQKTWNAIVTHFAQVSEPKVSHYQDAQGHHYYRAVNPLTRQSNTFGSEQEIRIWLDQQHY
jgi:hypothetical protein